MNLQTYADLLKQHVPQVIHTRDEYKRMVIVHNELSAKTRSVEEDSVLKLVKLTIDKYDLDKLPVPVNDVEFGDLFCELQDCVDNALESRFKTEAVKSFSAEIANQYLENIKQNLIEASAKCYSLARSALLATRPYLSKGDTGETLLIIPEHIANQYQLDGTFDMQIDVETRQLRLTPVTE